jgi:hypothetical protein
MRPLLAVSLLVVSVPMTAIAQPRGYTPAPVPNLPPPTVAPSERAGGPGLQAENTGPTDSTPFSAQPSGTLVGSDRLGQDSKNETPGGIPTTPNLSK